MPAPLNLIGQQFGRLTILARKENNKHGQSMILCRCACGTEKTIVAAAVKSGHTQSCSCINKEISKQRSVLKFVGRSFGRLTVLARRGTDKHRAATWVCRCSCGSELVVVGNSLRSGNTKSCGCLEMEKRLRTGELSNAWKGGATPANQLIRTSDKYKSWRTAVFIRDNFLCRECGDGGRLHAHHIKAFAAFPELRFEIENGQTLCISCHKKTPNYAGKQKIISHA